MGSGLMDVLDPVVLLARQRREKTRTAEAGLNWLHGPPATRGGTHPWI